jgi:putative ABC transport system ATP-binding protein
VSIVLEHGAFLGSLIEAIDLSKTYHKGRIPVPVLKGVSFAVDDGQFVSITGRSGSGKSTLLNLLGGLDTPTSGTVLVGSADLAELGPRGLARHRRTTVGMVFQSFNLIPSRTALENVTLALALNACPRRERPARASEVLSTVGLGHRLDHRPGELSWGEAQRVAIARSLVNGPEILLADEPTGNLDSVTAGEIVALLRRLNQERSVTVVMVTHEEDTAHEVSDRVFRLKDGVLVEHVPRGSAQ